MLETICTKVQRVGIYKDTNEPDTYVLVLKTREGTTYFAFGYNDFIQGWFQEVVPTQGKGQRYAKYQKANGVIHQLQRCLGRPLPPYVIDALIYYQVTPTVLSRCGKTSPRRIKWVEPKRGNWGGRRK